jgi:hypothetical protein
VKASPFYFEVKDLITQFVAAFDDIVIKRYNKNREVQDRIQVRYIYAPKDRVLYDIINLDKTLTLPCVAVNINSISRDSSRVFNKLEGFYYNENKNDEKKSTFIKSPVPINVDVSVSILTRYQTDMDQILSNFVPFCNPYVVISWYVPKQFNLAVDQEIRSEVLWGGSISMSYPVELTSKTKARVTADTTFTIKGWLFKDEGPDASNIYYIDNNFHSTSILTNYEDLESQTYTFPPSSGLLPTMETVTVSANPSISDIYYNGVKLYDDLTISPSLSGTVLLYGDMFENVQNVLLSTNNTSFYTNLTAITGFRRQENITGEPVNYTIWNNNILTVQVPDIQEGKLRFIPYNPAGYAFSDRTLFTQSYSANSTFIIVE